MKLIELSADNALGTSGVRINLPGGFHYKLLGGNMHYVSTATAGNRGPRIEVQNFTGAIALANAPVGNIAPSTSLNMILMPGGAYRDSSALPPYNILTLGWPADFIIPNGWTILFQDTYQTDPNDRMNYILLFDQIPA